MTDPAFCGGHGYILFLVQLILAFSFSLSVHGTTPGSEVRGFTVRPFALCARAALSPHFFRMTSDQIAAFGTERWCLNLDYPFRLRLYSNISSLASGPLRPAFT